MQNLVKVLSFMNINPIRVSPIDLIMIYIKDKNSQNLLW